MLGRNAFTVGNAAHFAQIFAQFQQYSDVIKVVGILTHIGDDNWKNHSKAFLDKICPVAMSMKDPVYIHWAASGV